MVGGRAEEKTGLGGDVEMLVAGGRLSMAVAVARLVRLGAVIRQYGLHVLIHDVCRLPASETLAGMESHSHCARLLLLHS